MGVNDTITAFQANAFQFNAFQIALGSGANYFLLRPHVIFDVYIEQWTTVRAGFEIPDTWVPTMEVDPLNRQAVDAFYAAGPRIQPQSTGWEMQNWKNLGNRGTVWFRPTTYWFQVTPGVWKLSGLGASKPPVTV